MSKIAIITDLHFGARKNDPLFLYHQLQWLEEFKQYITSNNITTVINMGDVFDNRLQVDINILNIVYNQYIEPLSILKHFIIAGNHDLYYRDSNNTSILHTWKDKLTLIDNKVTRLTDNIILVPWINKNNYVEITEVLQKIPDKHNITLLGHFQMTGIPANSEVKEGIPASFFKPFKQVLSGHYHNQSKTNNIYYTGNPFYLTWNDYNTPKGFHILDTETHKTVFIPNDDKVFFTENLEEINTETHHNHVIKLYVKGIEQSKDKVNTVLDALHNNNNKVEVIDTEIYDDNNIPLYIKEDEYHRETSSKEFITEIIQSLDIDRKDETLDYMLSLVP